MSRFVVEACKHVQPDKGKEAEYAAYMADMHALYGPELVPDEIASLFNVCLEEPLHASSDEQDMRALRGKFLKALQRHILRVDTHPVVTRFWTFAQCVLT